MARALEIFQTLGIVVANLYAIYTSLVTLSQVVRLLAFVSTPTSAQVSVSTTPWTMCPTSLMPTAVQPTDDVEYHTQTYVWAHYCNLDTNVCDVCCGVYDIQVCNLYEFGGRPFTCETWDWKEQGSLPTTPRAPDGRNQPVEPNRVYMTVIVEKYGFAALFQLGLAISHVYLFTFSPIHLIIWCYGGVFHVLYLWMLSVVTTAMMFAEYDVPTTDFLQMPIVMGLVFIFILWVSFAKYDKAKIAKEKSGITSN